MRRLALLAVLSVGCNEDVEDMPLAKEVVPIEITGGLASKTGPLVQVPGSFLQLDDVRQERLHEWRNRQGITHNDALDDLAGPPVRSVELPGGGVVAIGVGGVNANAGLSYSRNVPSTAARWTNLGTGCSQVRPTQWTRTPVATELFPVYLTTAAVGNGLRFVAWKPGNATVGQNPIRATIVSDADGTTVAATASLGSVAAASPASVYMSAAKLFMLFYADGANLHAAKWDATTGAFISDTVIKGNVAAASQFIDALYYTGTNVSVIYRNNAGNVHQLEVTPTTLALVADADLGVQCDFTLQLLPDPDGSGTRLIGVSNVIPEVRVVRTSAAAAILTNDLIAAHTSTNIAGVAYQAGAGYQIVWDNGGNNAMYAAKKRSGAVGAITQLTPIYGVGTVFKLDSNAWRGAGADAMRYMIGLHIGGFGTSGDFQHTYYEMALPFETGGSAISDRYTEPQARLLPFNAGLPVAGFNALPQVSDVAAGARFTLPLKRVSAVQLAAGVVANRYAVDTWSQAIIAPGDTTDAGPGVVGPQSSYLPVGQLMQSSVGGTIYAHGASALPFQPTTALVAHVGGLTIGAVYQYVVSEDYPDDGGNVWRSAASIASTPRTITAGNEQIDVTVRLSSIENHNRMRTVKIWRVLGNGSLATAQLVNQRTILTDVAASQFVFSDVVPDATLAASNFLPPGLPATITPAFNHVAFFDGRMWGAERDFPNRLRFTRLMQKGVQPEFPAEFFKDVEDELGDIVGIAALDDKLIVLKEGGLFFVAPGGPNDDGSGNQYVVTRVTKEEGGTLGAPYVSTGAHVYFIHNGIRRIGINLAVEYIGEPLDRYFNQPLVQTPETPISFTFNHRRDEIRLLTTNYRFVFDLENGVWIRDTGTAISDAVYTQTLTDVGDMFFKSNGQVWWDYDTETLGASVDASGPIHGVLRAPWLRAQIEGYIRLYKLRGLYAREPAGTGSTWPTTTVYFNEDDAISETDGPAGVTGATKQTVETRTKRMKCSAFSPKITLPSGDLRWRLNGWSALLAVKRVMHMASAGARGRQTTFTLPSLGMILWVKGDVGLTSLAGVATAFADQSGHSQDLSDLPGNPGPFTGLDAIDGIPCLTWALDGGHGAGVLRGLFRSAGIVDRNGVPMGYGPGETQPRTIMAVLKPRFSAATFNITGGIVAEFGSTPAFQPLFDLEDTAHPNGFWLFSTGWRDPAAGALGGPDTVGGAGGVYDGASLLTEWKSSGFNNITAAVNGVATTLAPSVIPGATGPTINPIFALGRQSSGGFNFFGALAEFVVWDYALAAAELSQARLYFRSRYPSIPITV